MDKRALEKINFENKITRMQLIEVNDKKTERAFLLLPVSLYKNDPNWIRPLDKDILFVFD